MLKFIRGKGHHVTAERQKLQKELFSFRKTVSHGFLSKPSALAWDPKLHLMAIGTRIGCIGVFGVAGVEFHEMHSCFSSKECSIIQLFFLPGEGRLISLCDANSLILWEFNKEDDKHWFMEKKKSCSLEGRLKTITTCCLKSNGEHLLIGTEGGNIYILDVKSFTMAEIVIYLDVIIQNVPDDYKVNPGAVEAIAEHPSNPDKIVIGYNRGLLVMWDIKNLNSEQTYIANQQLEYVTWHRSGKSFMSAHNDGSYITWSAEESSPNGQSPQIPYGPFPCKAINKVLWKSFKGGDDYIIFSGGMPRASYGDKHTVTVMYGDKHQVLDFTSKVIDFFTISDVDLESDFDNPHSLVVLVEEELVVIDLDSNDWLPFRPPYLASLHSSAITCSQHCSNVPQSLWNKIITAGNNQVAGNYTEREWPIIGGKPTGNQSEMHDLLLTGHEDGTVRFWNASGVALNHLYTFRTADFFVGEENESNTTEEGDWPPFRKVGTFDPYSDDPRLAVKKIVLCVLSGTLVVAGTAGQVVVAEIQEEKVEKNIEVVTMNIVADRDRDNFVWKGHSKLDVKPEKQAIETGFQPVVIIQMSPPAAITALALHSNWGLTAAGTSHGFGLFDYIQKKPVMPKCTLNASAFADLVSSGDGTISRRKSFKKSLRESFRRLRKGRSQRAKRDKTPTKATSDETNKRAQETRIDTDTPTSGDNVNSPSVHHEPKPVERQVEFRTSEDAFGSMVRCLYLAQSFIISNANTTPTLWAGTNAGAIYVFTIDVPTNEKRNSSSVTCQLGKEIQLKHRAPVIAIQIMDNTGYPLPEPLEVENQRAKAPELVGNHRVLICSEEQFKVFTLPSLKPYGKFKLTAHEGSRVRKVGIINFKSKADENYSEHCITCLSNQGDLSIYSIPDLRRQLDHSCLKREDINGISSLIFTKDGEGFYLQSPCEFKRFSLSASKVTYSTFQLELPDGARPQIIPTVDGNLKDENTTVDVCNKDENTDATGENTGHVIVAVVEVEKDAEAKEKDDSVPKNTDSLNEKKESAELETSQSEGKVETNTSLEDKKDLDITIDSVTDHLATLSSEESRVESTTVEKTEDTKTVTTQETVRKVTSVSTSVTREITLNSTGEFSDQACDIQTLEDVMKNFKISAFVPNSPTPKENDKAPTAQLEEFNHIDEDGA